MNTPPPWLLAGVVLAAAALWIYKKEGFTASPNSRNMIVPHLQNPVQNAFINQPYGPHNRTIPSENFTSEQSPMQKDLPKVQAIARGTIPTDENLQTISGGSQEAANVPLTSAYKPHQERIYPDQHPRPSYSHMTATVHTDAGTQAEEIRKNTVRTPSIRELVREESKGSSETFMNPYAIQYQQI